MSAGDDDARGGELGGGDAELVVAAVVVAGRAVASGQRQRQHARFREDG